VRNRRKTPRPTKPTSTWATNPTASPPATPTTPATPPPPPATTPPGPPPPPFAAPDTAALRFKAHAQSNYDIAVQGQFCGDGFIWHLVQLNLLPGLRVLADPVRRDDVHCRLM
jgi:hypothetical protein